MLDPGPVLATVAVTAQTLANFCLSQSGLASGWTWIAFALLAVHFFLWSQALALAPLTSLIPWTALGPLLNAWLAGRILGEKVGRRRWLGTLWIVMGIYLCA